MVEDGSILAAGVLECVREYGHRAEVAALVHLRRDGHGGVGAPRGGAGNRPEGIAEDVAEEIGERRAGKTMRQFIKSWITDWDIQRLYGTKEQIEAGTIESDYTENADLEQAPQPEPAEEDVS